MCSKYEYNDQEENDQTRTAKRKVSCEASNGV